MTQMWKNVFPNLGSYSVSLLKTFPSRPTLSGLAPGVLASTDSSTALKHRPYLVFFLGRTSSLNPIPTQNNPYSLMEGVESPPPQCFSHNTIGLETNSEIECGRCKSHHTYLISPFCPIIPSPRKPPRPSRSCLT